MISQKNSVKLLYLLIELTHYFKNLRRPRCAQCGKTQKSLTENFFREIIHLVKMLLSRNLCLKLVRVKFRDFHILAKIS